MRVRVEEVVETDDWQSQHGTMYGIKFTAFDEADERVFLGVNAKKPDAIRPGDEFNFLASGKTAGKWVLGKREQGSLGHSGGSGGGGSAPSARSPQNAPTGAQGALPLAATAPTMTERGAEFVALLPRCVAGVDKGWMAYQAKAHEDGKPAFASPSSDAILAAATSLAMHLLIGKDQGKLRDADAEARAAKAEADRLRKEADRLAEEAAKKTPGYGEMEDDEPLPF